ncbi:amidohydrolase family protein [SAR202 cluster bacterium AD-804-J14_MRT_500m]|nr:amidohydrolase family protein [SAR202 cluster bacterium AD-804-J14_MRT_500m]
METPIPMNDVFTYLRPGDIATHAFHGDRHSILDSAGLVRPEVWDAYNSGIIFDTGGAARHCSFTISQYAVNQGLIPHTISTDRTVPRPNSFNYSLHQHMSIFLELGLSTSDVINCVTSNPARVIGKDDLGTFKTGSIGDASIMSLAEGDYEFDDGLGHTLYASQLFTPVSTIKDGVLWASGT